MQRAIYCDSCPSTNCEHKGEGERHFQCRTVTATTAAKDKHGHSHHATTLDIPPGATDRVASLFLLIFPTAPDSWQPAFQSRTCLQPRYPAVPARSSDLPRCKTGSGGLSHLDISNALVAQHLGSRGALAAVDLLEAMCSEWLRPAPRIGHGRECLCLSCAVRD